MPLINCYSLFINKVINKSNHSELLSVTTGVGCLSPLLLVVCHHWCWFLVTTLDIFLFGGSIAEAANHWLARISGEIPKILNGVWPMVSISQFYDLPLQMTDGQGGLEYIPLFL